MLSRLKNFIADSIASNMVDVASNGSRLQMWALEHSLESILSVSDEDPAKALFDVVSMAPLAPRDSEIRDTIVERAISLADIVASTDLRSASIAVEFLPFSPPSSAVLKLKVAQRIAEFGKRAAATTSEGGRSGALSCSLGV